MSRNNNFSNKLTFAIVGYLILSGIGKKPTAKPSPTSGQAPGNPTPPGPGIDALHRDIAFANTYRLELVKLLMTLSGALLAFTVTFRPELQRVLWSQAMWLGWFGLAVSMVGGMVNMHGWDRYYMSYRDFDHKHRNAAPPEDGGTLGRRRRDEINGWRRMAMYCQFGGFALGVAGVAVFAALNVDAKRATDPVTSACCAAKPAASAAPAPHAETLAPATRGRG